MGTSSDARDATVLGVLFGLAWIFFSLRVYVKIFLLTSWRADDMLLLVAIIIYATYTTCQVLWIKSGFAEQVSDTRIDGVPKELLLLFLSEILYSLNTFFIRLSISLFLTRICIERMHKIIIYTTMAMVVGSSTFYFFLVLFQCSPVSFFWNRFEGGKGHCLNPTFVGDASIAYSAVSFTADWVLGLWPITIIWNLQIGRCTKLSIGAILAVGLIAGVAAIIRIPYIRLFIATDDLYAITNVGIWSFVETSLGIIAASACTLRPLCRSLRIISSNQAPGYTRNNPSCIPRYGDHTQLAPSPSQDIQLRRVPTNTGRDIASAGYQLKHSSGDISGASQERQLYEDQSGSQGCKTFTVTIDDHASEHQMPWPLTDSLTLTTSIV